MQTTADLNEAGARPPHRNLLLAIFLGLLIGAGALAVFVHQATYGVWNRIATRITGRALSIDVRNPR